MNSLELLEMGFNSVVGKHVHTVKSRMQIHNNTNLEDCVFNKCKVKNPCTALMVMVDHDKKTTTVEEKGGALMLTPFSSTALMVVDHDKKTTAMEEKGEALMLTPFSSVMEVAHDKKTTKRFYFYLILLMFILLFMLWVAHEEEVFELEATNLYLKAEKLEFKECQKTSLMGVDHDKKTTIKHIKYSKQIRKQMHEKFNMFDTIYKCINKKRTYKWEG